MMVSGGSEFASQPKSRKPHGRQEYDHGESLKVRVLLISAANDAGAMTPLPLRRVSTTLRQVVTEFSEFFHVIRTGLLIQTSLGRAGGLGALRTKRSG